MEFSVASDNFCSHSLEVMQSIIDAFSCDEFLNIIALENNPACRERILKEFVLKHEKSILFSSMAKRETALKDIIDTELATAKRGLAALQANIIFLKSALERSLAAKYGHSIEIVGEELVSLV
mmetsp:Transcript_2352/g.4305  ORF Transcript_2352/g.4305 Transcript_2352/m.4305 type:complete len:123 (-) Transcript_2352:90-458(-)